MRDPFQIWLDAVCEQVRFRPDRKGIARELRIHYEDHWQDLLRLGWTPELAEQRALAAMGNAQAVGWAVDQGVITGDSDAAFSPDRVCTRAEIATILWRKMA